MKKTYPFLLFYSVLIASVFCNTIVYSQTLPTQKNTIQERRNPLLGLHFSFSDFTPSTFNTAGLNSGYGISFTDGIAGKYDYSIQAGSISPKHFFHEYNTDKDLLHFINLNIVRRLYSDTVFFNPFINAGPGINLNSAQFFPSFIAGGGFQLRITSKIFLQTQFNYHFNISSAIDNNTSLNISLLGTIFQRKKSTASKKAPLSHLVLATPIISANDLNRYPDTDGDGIPDHRDSCPTISGFAKYHGCPIPVTGDDSLSFLSKINTLASQIFFETNKASLKPESIQPLNEVVSILKTNSSYRLQIEGHTDNTGTDGRNTILSQQRANAVLNYLTAHGIISSNLQAKGFGSSRPIADNTTEDGKRKNRRTEFKLVASF